MVAIPSIAGGRTKFFVNLNPIAHFFVFISALSKLQQPRSDFNIAKHFNPTVPHPVQIFLEQSKALITQQRILNIVDIQVRTHGNVAN